MSATVRRLVSDDWQLWREVRLAALADAPHAFASTLAKEQAYVEASWRNWLRRDRGMKAVAIAGTTAIGLVGAWLPETRQGAVELYSMWVQPLWRGRGVGDLLVTEVLDWARENHHKRIDLWVVEGNSAAETLYQRHGFRATDEHQPHPSQPDLRERVWTRELDDGSPVL
jgi:GNAT superfamily N-acetyltransferase